MSKNSAPNGGRGERRVDVDDSMPDGIAKP
jgi:hypothetical protein